MILFVYGLINRLGCSEPDLFAASEAVGVEDDYRLWLVSCFL